MAARHRRPLDADDKHTLSYLLRAIPEQQAIVRDWGGTAGQQFLKAVTAIHGKGVPTVWIADELGIGRGALANALGAYGRKRAEK